MRAVRAVVFDFFGTLVPATPSRVWDEMAARSAAPLGIAADRWRWALDTSFPERTTGALGDLTATFRELALRCGVEPDEGALRAACAARTAAQRELFVPRPDSVGTLRALRAAGLRVGVLSDCSVELAEAWRELPVSDLVDARVLSCEEGRRKPDPELFASVAERVGVAPRECLYVGDGDGDELAGATRAGMRAVLLRAPDWQPGRGTWRKPAWTGLTVAALSQVPALAALADTAAADG